MTTYLHTADCVEGSRPPCTCGCPANFNVKEFVRKITKGNFNSAYRELSNGLLFPGITTLVCEEYCRINCPAQVNLLALEKACVSFATSKDSVRYNIPRKPYKVAVIGAGLAGMASALKLASKNYDVIVYEQTSIAGGRLHKILDKEIIDYEFNLAFGDIPYAIEFNRKIEALDILKADAIIITTGNPIFADLVLKKNPVTTATEKPGVFHCTSIDKNNFIEEIALAIVSAASAERYLKTGAMSGEPESFIQQACTLPPIQPERILTHAEETEISSDKETAISEANMCVYCDCNICKDGCEFLKHFNLSPHLVERDAMMAANSMKGLKERVGSRMIYSCNVCGHCKSICPHDISVEDILLDSKKLLFRDGAFAPALHEYYLKDMESVMEETYLFDSPPGEIDYILFPGCQVTAAGSDYTESAYQYLKKFFPGTGLLMSCCGIPALWAGDEKLFRSVLMKNRDVWNESGKPKFVFMCPTCLKTIQRELPEIEALSFFELFASGSNRSCKSLENTSGLAKEWAVFDPCSSSGFPNMQYAVRDISAAKGITLSELADSFSSARCCGMGGHIYMSNKPLAKKTVARATSLSELPYVTYCVNCRNLFLAAGKKCVHILDFMFDLEPTSSPPHIADIRRNRLGLKKRIQSVDSIELEALSNIKSDIFIPESILVEMDRGLISADDVSDVILQSESNSEIFYDNKKNIFIGHGRIGLTTLWVEYLKKSLEPPTYEVVDVYSHRIIIGGKDAE